VELWPVFILLLNGAIGGFAVKMQAILFHHYSFQIWLFGLLPHGVPELGALFLAAGASFYYRRLRSQGERIAGRVLKTYLVVDPADAELIYKRAGQPWNWYMYPARTTSFHTITR